MYATIRCIPLVVSTSRSFPQSCLISGFVTWVTRRGCHIWIVPHILMYLLQKLWTLSPQRTMATPGVESYYKTIVDAMMKTDNEALPRKQFVKHLKSYWNKVADSMHASMRSKRFVWIKNGKVHDKNNCDYIEYKRSKRIFRNELELRIMNICVVFPINLRSLSILIRNIYGLYWKVVTNINPCVVN